MASSVILVTGVTGHVGSALIAQLAAHGQPVRAMTRWPDAVAVPPHRASVRHIVKLSVYSGCAGDDAIGAWHREAEAAVMDSGIEWTSGPPRS